MNKHIQHDIECAIAAYGVLIERASTSGDRRKLRKELAKYIADISDNIRNDHATSTL